MDKLTQNSAKKLQGEQVSISTKDIIELIFGKAKDKTEHNKFKQIIARRAKKENWEFDKSINKNIGKYYFIYSLPENIKQNYFSNIQKHTSTLPEIKNHFSSLVNRERSYLPIVDNSQFNELPKKEELIGINKANLVSGYIDSYTGKTNKKKYQFDYVKSYNLNLPTFQSIYEVLGPVTFQTLNRWRKIYLDANKDYRSLAPNYQKSKEDNIPEHQKAVLLKTFLQPNKPLKSEVARLCRNEFIRQGHTKILSEKTYINYLNRYQSNNYDIVKFYREGYKALNDDVIPYFKRDRESVNVGDIIVPDGHNLNFNIIDPVDGKPKRGILILYQDFRSRYALGYDIAFSENKVAIKTALFRSILILGKKPQVVYQDNGRAFNANEFIASQAIFERAGISYTNAIAYHAQSKPIERFFRTAGEFERQIKSYIGTSIKNQPAYLHRGEKLHQEINKKVNNTVPTLYEVYYALSLWFEELHSRPTRALKGKTPKEIFEAGKGPGVNKLELMFLMMTVETKSVRRGAISLFGEEYVSKHFYGIKKSITIRYDFIDLKFSGTVYCFDSNTGNFICTASKKNLLHPAAGILGTEEDVKLLEKELKNRSILVKSTTANAREFLQKEIIPTVKKQIAVAEIEREKNEAEEIKKTGTDDTDFSLDFLKQDKSVSRKEDKPRTWIDQ
jgi:putative transposase